MQNTNCPRIRLIRAGNAIDESLLQQLCSGLERDWGVSISFGPEVLNGCSPADRAARLHSYIISPDFDVLWTVWGGEGAADLLPFLGAKFPKDIPPKHLIGSSDATALLLYLANRKGVFPVHAPNFGRLPVITASPSYDLLKRFVRGELDSIVATNLIPLNGLAKGGAPVKSSGSTGGNLSLLTISIGDTWEFDPAGKIVFVEDWREKAHVIDRNLKSLSRRGKFSDAAALILGNIFCQLQPTRGTDPEEQTSYLRERVSEFANALPIPVFETDVIGHGPDNLPIPFHWTAEITGTDPVHLTLRNPKT